jgi:hypothetical protein
MFMQKRAPGTQKRRAFARAFVFYRQSALPTAQNLPAALPTDNFYGLYRHAIAKAPLRRAAPKNTNKNSVLFARPLPTRFCVFIPSVNLESPRAAVPDFACAPRKTIEHTLPGQGLLRIAVSFCKDPGQRCLLYFPWAEPKNWQNKKAQRAVCPVYISRFLSRAHKA